MPLALCRYEDLIDRSGQGLLDLMNEVKSRFEIDGLCRSEGVVNSGNESALRQRTAGIELEQVNHVHPVPFRSFSVPFRGVPSEYAFHNFFCR